MLLCIQNYKYTYQDTYTLFKIEMHLFIIFNHEFQNNHYLHLIPIKSMKFLKFVFYFILWIEKFQNCMTYCNFKFYNSKSIFPLNFLIYIYFLQHRASSICHQKKYYIWDCHSLLLISIFWTFIIFSIEQIYVCKHEEFFFE